MNKIKNLLMEPLTLLAVYVLMSAFTTQYADKVAYKDVVIDGKKLDFMAPLFFGLIWPLWWPHYIFGEMLEEE